MTDREALQQYRQTVQAIRAVQWQLSRLQMTGRPSGAHAQQYAAAVCTNDPAAAAVQLFEGLEQQLHAHQQHLTELTTRFQSIASRASSPLITVILYRYYALAETDSQVADAAGRSRRRICQLRSEFLSTLN